MFISNDDHLDNNDARVGFIDTVLCENNVLLYKLSPLQKKSCISFHTLLHFTLNNVFIRLKLGPYDPVATFVKLLCSTPIL